MPRYFYIGLFAVAVVATLFFYRTSSSEIQDSTTAKFGGVSLRIEYATTAATRERGLGGRESVPNDYGMLFIFAKDDYYGFWMKDMLVPIDIFWLDDKGQVVGIEERVATSTYPHVFYPDTPARYVLETAASFAAAHDIVIGSLFVLKNLKNVSK